jgi:hypothetical protein
MSIVGSSNSPTDITYLDANIFDSTCYQLGSEDDPKSGDSLDSSLPYTVELKSLAFGATGPSMQFCYAANCTDSNDGGTAWFFRRNPFGSRATSSRNIFIVVP